MSVLVLDLGSSSIRAALASTDRVLASVQRPIAVNRPFPGLVELDAEQVASAALSAAREVAAQADDPVAAVGIATQRASCLLWRRDTGKPVGPVLSWQDLRTVGACIQARAEGTLVAPSHSATKWAWLLEQATSEGAPADQLCAGTLDCWLAWTLTNGALHVTDPSNASLTGLLEPGSTTWSQSRLGALGLPESILPTIVDSIGRLPAPTTLPGSPPIAALLGDQQASLLGQGGVVPGRAKATFGTGAMLDVFVGPSSPTSEERTPTGAIAVVAWSHAGRASFALEAVMLSAGSAVDWLVEDLGILNSAEESAAVASQVADTAGAWFVPALAGMGTPAWDYGAQGIFLGLSGASRRPHLVRAVLVGLAERGADLLEAVEPDAGAPIETLRIDGGVASNPVFCQALADAIGRRVEVSPEREATALGAGRAAELALDELASPADLADLPHGGPVFEPSGADPERARWLEARERALRQLPELSALAL